MSKRGTDDELDDFDAMDGDDVELNSLLATPGEGRRTRRHRDAKRKAAWQCLDERNEMRRLREQLEDWNDWDDAWQDEGFDLSEKL